MLATNARIAACRTATRMAGSILSDTTLKIINAALLRQSVGAAGESGASTERRSVVCVPAVYGGGRELEDYPPHLSAPPGR